MNSYQMVLHQPVEPAGIFGNFDRSQPLPPKPAEFDFPEPWQNPVGPAATPFLRFC
jgi:hypothetical protein